MTFEEFQELNVKLLEVEQEMGAAKKELFEMQRLFTPQKEKPAVHVLPSVEPSTDHLTELGNKFS